ncbi:dihydrodipicolinate synthase family protein [Inmirania thermothiophila]|uniref:4-hydroxy-tetrahydrodipicolinate synthase n=1 Tax=Inmirania thermothiophila TaxID=1750597 RepID=A0A3N1YBZ3_9GAMM|nr:dihydrodipicolinate synthase family protein [Inmirania thermothiophila]ROR35202.1 4-hydroxy-tetrahydrodipicolinate synthase [Inmirania thermothiophila]
MGADGPVSGIWSPTLTPLGDDGAIDVARLAAHVRWQLEGGCHGVVLFGTTGEGPSFTAAERMQALEGLLAQGVDARRLVVGTGCCALPDTVTLTRHALACGCRAVLVLPPFYFKDVSAEGLRAAFAQVVEAVGDARLRMLLYHFPRLSGVPIPPAVLGRLAADFPGVVCGVKDSSGDPDSLHAFLGAGEGLCVLPGTEALLLAGLRAGAAGCISAGANVNPGGLRAVWAAWQAGDEAAAEAAQAAAGAVRAALAGAPMIPGLKALTARRTADAAWLAVRPPLRPLDPEAAARLAAAVAAVRPGGGGPAR